MKTLSTSTELGETIRTRRRELGATQKDLALAAGTGLRFIIDLEKGKPSCQTGKMLLVLQALGLSLALHAGDKTRPDTHP